MTYDDFSARLAMLLQVDPTTDADWAVFLPQAVEAAELRCYRDLDPLAVRKSAQIPVAAAAATFTLPSDCSIPRDLSYVALPAGVSSPHIARRDDTFLLELCPPGSVSGNPKYWALTAADAGLLAPAPSGTVTLSLSYTFRPTPLAASNENTWLATWCPDLMIAAAMVFGSGYQRNYGAQADDPQQGVSWETQYGKLLAGAAREESRRKAEGYYDASKAAPPSSTRPTGATAP